MDITILYWILVAVMAVSAIGAFLPGIPGAVLILAAIVVWERLKVLVVLLCHWGSSCSFAAEFWR
jgi:uncharacterized protein YqgC (DUF456 family)